MQPVYSEEINQTYLEAVEGVLQQAVKRANDLGSDRLYEMLSYHMGWESGSSGDGTRGKRLRPLLVLLSCAAAGGDWQLALPAASAVELVHNFSLIHDDIEDESPTRRGRPTVWKKWGIPQAVNCGDAMFALAHLEVTRLALTVSPSIAIKAVELLQSTCLRLTQGQYLDLSFESRNDVTIEEYWRMVEGKTAALMAASSELGALSAACDDQTGRLYHLFGHDLGLAFQAQDDLLGIWGDSVRMGKSSQSDLLTHKVTLPVLHGLSMDSEFSARWKKGLLTPSEVPEVIGLLEAVGSKSFTEQQVQHYIDEALNTLEKAHPAISAAQGLKFLALSLVNRQA